MNSLRALRQEWLDEANAKVGNPLELALECQKRICADALQPFIEREEADEVLILKLANALDTASHQGEVNKNGICPLCALVKKARKRLGE